jgi:hypothetical protein
VNDPCRPLKQSRHHDVKISDTDTFARDVIKQHIAVRGVIVGYALRQAMSSRTTNTTLRNPARNAS